MKNAWYIILDNFGFVCLVNIGAAVITGIFVFLLSGLADNFLIFLIAALFGSLILSWYLFGCALLLNRLRLGGNAGISGTVAAFIKTLKRSLGFGVFLVMCFLIPMTAVPFYFSLGSFAGYIPIILLFCTLIIIIPAVLIHIPLATLRTDGFFPVFFNSLKLLFAEAPVIVLTTVNTLCILALSALSAFLFPGAAMALVLLEETADLILKIYDKEMSEEQIMDMLNREAEKTESRSLKTTIMPWKK